MNTLALKNETMQLTFDRRTGMLVGLRALESNWDILNRSELGRSFRLLVPMRTMAPWRVGKKGGERRNNIVWGEKQTLTSLAVSADQRTATFTWDDVISEHAGPLAIKVTIEVALSDRQATWKTTIDNRSPYPVENVYSPYLGDLQRPSGATSFKSFTIGYAEPAERNLWPTFDNTRGYFGNDLPILVITRSPYQPFCLLRSPDVGLYVGVGSNDAEVVSMMAELTPGYDNAIDSHVPAAASIAGKPVATPFAAVHVPHVMPNETRHLTPIVLEPYRGSWHAGAEIYKRWRNSWMSIAQPPAWANQPHAWQQIHINSPEDELRMPFKELPAIGEECARHGVAAIQLVGWNDGGQDQGNPSHDPDPRLGTPQELRAAIEKIHAMGVHVILFSKFTWADRGSEEYRNLYRRMAVKDPYGDEYVYGGYQYQTMTQFLDINTKRLVPMCFLDESYLQVCDKEFDKLVNLGAAGMLFDECLHHSPAVQCFDSHHTHRWGASVYANDSGFIRRLQKRAPASFLMAGEACYDWECDVYHVSYFRTWNSKHVPLWRYLLPQAQLMTAISGFNDRNMINQCLLYRYVMSYEPFNFKGRLDDYPATMAYGKQMDTLRTELRDWFWDGEFRDTLGSSVLAEGKPHHPYSVFVNAKTHRLGLVVANYQNDKPVTLEVTLDNNHQPLERWRLIDDATWHPFSQVITLPPASAAVII
ncbi:MAG: DUF6259 domain-containing protein [Phycisphaerales bacterium]|nr:DUF6259 domain-containing protein [Phycisphaerales bacterium]